MLGNQLVLYKICISKFFFKKSIKMHGMEISLKETLENMEISHNIRLSKENGEYILHIPYFRGSCGLGGGKNDKKPNSKQILNGLKSKSAENN